MFGHYYSLDAGLRRLLAATVCRHHQQCRQYITVRKWRAMHNMSQSTSPLNELPDWSYTDGRGFGPLTVGQKKRYLRDQELARSVINHWKDMQTAKQLLPDGGDGDNSK
ncbi:39S ribosomal protein L52, mitochondrial-like [Oppia nitens]|uniref:39S ribosomal protein L52, mitochondrial-like n=1 Tax=Oppia nitens TaxID=1686743 RepID=UPI0023DC61FB|nr:39S ribosomal protein L52, mitochondrial-like [Oppia nitens]